MDELMQFSDLIDQEKQHKNNGQFNWGKYVASLQKSLNKKHDIQLQNKVSEFILLTDLVDDLMDQDRPEIYEILLKNEDLLASSLLKSLNDIKELVSEQSYASFVDFISQALVYQQRDYEYKLSKESKEADYFSLVNRSVLLAQSIIYLVIDRPPEPLMEAMRLITISAQIENDLADLEKKVSYDLLDKKGTLPLIKIVEWLKQNNDNTLNEILNINKEDYLNMDLNRTINIIQMSPVIPYCQLLRVSLKNKAMCELREISFESLYSDIFG